MDYAGENRRDSLRRQNDVDDHERVIRMEENVKAMAANIADIKDCISKLSSTHSENVNLLFAKLDEQRKACESRMAACGKRFNATISRKTLSSIITIAVLIVGSLYGWMWYLEHRADVLEKSLAVHQQLTGGQHGKANVRIPETESGDDQ